MEEIKAELNAQLQNKIAFDIPLFGGIPVPQSTVITWVIIAILTVLAIWLTHGLNRKPGRRQIVAEIFVGFINGFCKNTLGEKYWRTFAPYLGTIGLYLGLANISGLFGVTPPTKDLNVTAGLAIMSAILIYGAQFRYHGLGGGLKKFGQPVAIVAPLNVMEIGIRPLSLCMRLFGNIFAGFVIMELLKMLMPVVLPIPFSLYFDVFDGMLQAIVFVFLTTLFLSESLD
ncbi:F0F1 ATP synthase subunit A [Butyricicoccus sp.]|uniref:F0F1 ATP synthase subunit A n=1 Tax=Butyricicoccus sp. TaxID=2049021 RepID=UPI003D7D01FF